MPVIIKVRFAGKHEDQVVELPEGAEGAEVRGVTVHVVPGMRVNIEVPDKGWRSGSVHTALFLNELEDKNNPPDIYLSAGEVHRDDPNNLEDLTWKNRTDAMLYSADSRIVAKDQTHNNGYKEHVISKKPWKNVDFKQ